MIEPKHWIQAATPTTQLTSASDLDSQPDAAFELAQAPDGLMLAMHVRRATDVRVPVLQALHADARLTREIERPLAELERITRSHSISKRIVRTGKRAYYKSVSSVAGHLGATLLARMIGAVSSQPGWTSCSIAGSSPGGSRSRAGPVASSSSSAAANRPGSSTIARDAMRSMRRHREHGNGR